MTDRPEQNADTIGDENIARLISRSYDPELPNQEFLQGLEDTMVKMARTRPQAEEKPEEKPLVSRSRGSRASRLNNVARLVAVTACLAIAMVLTTPMSREFSPTPTGTTPSSEIAQAPEEAVVAWVNVQPYGLHALTFEDNLEYLLREQTKLDGLADLLIRNYSNKGFMDPQDNENISSIAQLFVSEPPDDEWRYWILYYKPQLASAPSTVTHDWIFVVETSGDRTPELVKSQSQIVKNVLERSDSSAHFSVIAASTTPVALAESPLTINENHIENSVNFLNTSHLVGALDLELAFQMTHEFVQPDRPAAIVHVGAGFTVLGEREPTKLLASLPDSSQYFSISVGDELNAELLESISLAKKGALIRATRTDTAQSVSKDLTAALNGTLLSSISVSTEDSAVSFVNNSNAVASGDLLVSVARAKKNAPTPNNLTLQFVRQGSEVVTTLNYDVQSADAELAMAWVDNLGFETESLIEGKGVTRRYHGVPVAGGRARQSAAPLAEPMEDFKQSKGHLSAVERAAPAPLPKASSQAMRPSKRGRNFGSGTASKETEQTIVEFMFESEPSRSASIPRPSAPITQLRARGATRRESEKQAFSSPHRQQVGQFAETLPMVRMGLDTVFQTKLKSASGFNRLGEIDFGAYVPALSVLRSELREDKWYRHIPEPESQSSLLVAPNRGFYFKQMLPSGLEERVTSDGISLWHTYPDIQLATTRKLSIQLAQPQQQGVQIDDSGQRGLEANLSRYVPETSQPITNLWAKGFRFEEITHIPEIKPDESTYLVIPSVRYLADDQQEAGKPAESDPATRLGRVLFREPEQVTKILLEDYLAQGDRRLGLYYLLLSHGFRWNVDRPVAIGETQVELDPEKDHPGSATAKAMSFALRVNDRQPWHISPHFAVPYSTFFRKMSRSMATPIAESLPASTESDASDSLFATSILCDILSNQKVEPGTWGTLATTINQKDTNPSVRSALIARIIDELHDVGAIPQASTLVCQQIKKRLEKGTFPRVETEFLRILKDDAATLDRRQLIESARKQLERQPRELFRLAWFGHQVTEDAMATEIAASARLQLEQGELADRRIAATYYSYRSDHAQAANMLSKLGGMEAWDITLWSLASTIHGRAGNPLEKLYCRAMWIRQQRNSDRNKLVEHIPEIRELLKECARLSPDLLPKDHDRLKETIVILADEWRIHDPLGHEPCVLAALALAPVDGSLSWKYLSTTLIGKDSAADILMELTRIKSAGNKKLALIGYKEVLNRLPEEKVTPNVLLGFLNLDDNLQFSRSQLRKIAEIRVLRLELEDQQIELEEQIEQLMKSVEKANE